MKIQVAEVKKLRAQTGAGIMDCRRAIIENNHDLVKAAEWLRQNGLQKADKKSAREVKSGLVEAYTHPDGRVVAVIELACETDFVARTDEFKKLAHELALQVAAMSPASVDELLDQPYIRDAEQTIEQLVKGVIGKLGENIVVRRLVRFELGEKN